MREVGWEMEDQEIRVKGLGHVVRNLDVLARGAMAKR